jgi:transposase
MVITSQNRAIKNYRSRLRKQGLGRFEVLALESDRDLIRSLARRLAQNDPESERIRQDVRLAIADESSSKGSILAALRRSPFVQMNSDDGLQIVRSKETGRQVDL